MDRPLTPEYAKEIADAFVQAYYQSFDNGPRENLTSLYVPDNETSLMTFEGGLIRGQQAIVDKLKVANFFNYRFIYFFKPNIKHKPIKGIVISKSKPISNCCRLASNRRSRYLDKRNWSTSNRQRSATFVHTNILFAFCQRNLVHFERNVQIISS